MLSAPNTLCLCLCLRLCLLAGYARRAEGGGAGCDAVVLNRLGQVDITKSVRACAFNMTDPEIIHSYRQAAAEPVQVHALMRLNNLVAFEDTHATAEVELELTLSWIDPRWNMSAFWATRTQSTVSQGIALEQLVFTSSSNRLRLWLPDVAFVDLLRSSLAHQNLKLREGGLLSWTRHMNMVVMQPHFDYQRFPLDSHDLILRFGSLAYSDDFLRLHFSDDAVSFDTSADPSSGDVTWELNKKWLLDDGAYSTHVESHTSSVTIDEELAPRHGGGRFVAARTSSGVVVTSTFDYASASLQAKRISHGLLIRLGFPILALMVLAGLIFWASYELRISSTMRILYAVSALYIVIFRNVPMIGSSTDFDVYILVMYMTITAAVGVHQFIYRICEKADRRPLRYLISRVLELCGRVVVIPLSAIFFINMFFDTTTTRTAFITVLLIVMGLVAVRDFAGLRRHVIVVMKYFEERKKSNELHTMSTFELRVYHWYEWYRQRHWGFGSAERGDDEEEYDSDEEYNKANTNPMRDSSVIGDSGYGRSFFDLMPAGIRDSNLEDGTEPDVVPAATPAAHKRKNKKKMKKQAIIDQINGVSTTDQESSPASDGDNGTIFKLPSAPSLLSTLRPPTAPGDSQERASEGAETDRTSLSGVATLNRAMSRGQPGFTPGRGRGAGRGRSQSGIAATSGFLVSNGQTVCPPSGRDCEPAIGPRGANDSVRTTVDGVLASITASHVAPNGNSPVADVDTAYARPSESSPTDSDDVVVYVNPLLQRKSKQS